jgi:homoserine dehydrogenase
LREGRHVVTANKGPIALHYQELAALAAASGVALGVEGTVMGGTPVMRLGSRLLADAGIRSAQGILNGTTNFILSRMAAGESYAAALGEAQARGYAEADPTADVEGYDAAVKTVILGNLLLGGQLGMADVDRAGISTLTLEDVEAARSEGAVWKLIGRVERDGDRLSASVGPRKLPLTHPLAAVSGPTNAITLTTDLLGDVTLVGPGAGRVETGYALLSDLLAIHHGER